MADPEYPQKPGVGAVGRLSPTWSTAASKTTRSGKWRPQKPFESEAMQVILLREQGITRPGYLGHQFRFQTGPLDSFPRDRAREWSSYRTISDGEFDRSGGRTLATPSFSVLLHDEPKDWMVWRGTFDVQRMIQELNALVDGEVIFRLVVGQPALWGGRPLLSILAKLTAVTPEQRAGEIGSEYVTLAFQEHRRQRLIAKGARKRPSATSQTRRYTLKDGDTLYSIAKAAYSGTASAWRAVAKKNGITGVDPGDRNALKAWARRKNKKTIVLPGSSDRIETVGSSTYGGSI